MNYIGPQIQLEQLNIFIDKVNTKTDNLRRQNTKDIRTCNEEKANDKAHFIVDKVLIEMS